MASATVYFFKMANCGFCIQFEPLFVAFKNKHSKLHPNIHFKIIELTHIPEFERKTPKIAKLLNTSEINSFPDLRMVILKGSKYTMSKYTGDRTIPDITRWIESKTGDKKGGSKKRRTRRRSRKMKGGKWSRKYKKSINCRRPRGFSQKQYCKYGRKK